VQHAGRPGQARKQDRQIVDIHRWARGGMERKILIEREEAPPVSYVKPVASGIYTYSNSAS
jgi:hypothetical protein